MNGMPLRAAARATGMTYLSNHEPTLWLRGQINALVNQWVTGDFTPCKHLVQPSVGVVALWRSDRVYCGACAPDLRLTGDADRTCDRCSAVVPTIHSCVIAPLPMALVMFGLCPACHRREVPA